MHSRVLYRKLLAEEAFPLLAVIAVENGRRRYRLERLTE
jgi:hypothetical protein